MFPQNVIRYLTCIGCLKCLKSPINPDLLWPPSNHQLSHCHKQLHQPLEFFTEEQSPITGFFAGVNAIWVVQTNKRVLKTINKFNSRNTAKSINTLTFQHYILNGSRKIPPGKIPARKIPIHQTSPWKIITQKFSHPENFHREQSHPFHQMYFFT